MWRNHFTLFLNSDFSNSRKIVALNGTLEAFVSEAVESNKALFLFSKKMCPKFGI